MTNPRQAMRTTENSGNDDGVARLERDVLIEMLALDDVLVVELEGSILPLFLAHDLDVLRVGVLLESTGERDELKHGHVTGERVGPGLSDIPNDVDLAAVDRLDNDGRVG